MEMYDQTVGVEVEMNHITREAAAQVCSETLARIEGRDPSLYPVTHEGGCYDKWFTRDSQGRKWYFVSDSSISGPWEERTEMNTPVLAYHDIPLLQEVIRALRAAGAKAHSSCGIHIHIGLGQHTPQTVRNLINLEAARDTLIEQSLQNTSRRDQWCLPTNRQFLEQLNQKKPTTWDQLEAIWYGSQGKSVSEHGEHYSDTRYHLVNLHSLFYRKAHGQVPTIEFRAFNSTLHAGKIKAYIQWCLAVSYQALTVRSASPKPVETDNPAYTFRCWLLRLGLNGDEFKTCRTHMMESMPGNAAWRNGLPTTRTHG